MRIINIATAIIVALSPIFGAFAQQGVNVSMGRELPSTTIVPYDSKESALSGNVGSSRYVQMLTGWNRQVLGDKTQYVIQFKKPFAWADRQQILHIDGAGGSYNVYVNGQHVGWTQSGMTPSGFDVTKYAIEGNNELRIEVLGNDPSRVLENREGRGSYRSGVSTDLVGSCYIYSPPKVRVRDFVVNTTIVQSGGLMELGLILKSSLLNTRDVKIHYQILNPNGKLAGEGSREASIDMRREDTIRFLIEIPEPRLWSHNNPNLYTVLVNSQFDGRTTEYVSFETAFLNVGVEKGEFVVNGTPVSLNVEVYEPTGDIAASDRDLRDMVSRGVNAIKIIGGPQSDNFYTLCDRLGLYLCVTADINTHSSGNSMKLGGNPSNDPNWTAAYMDRIMGMYHTSKSHPSVVIFSLAENSSNGICLYESYLALKRIESKLPVIYIDAIDDWNSDAVKNRSNKQVGYDGRLRMIF